MKKMVFVIVMLVSAGAVADPVACKKIGVFPEKVVFFSDYCPPGWMKA